MGTKSNQGKNKGKNKMTKLSLAILLLLSIAGCSDEITEYNLNNDHIKCLNGHLYYRNRNYAVSPLFDYRTDTPTLIRCEKRNGRIEYEEEKVK